MSSTDGGTTLLVNATVIDCTGRDPIENASLLVESGVIRSVIVGEHQPTADRVVDLNGQFLLPGLIDAHVHIGGVDHVGGQHRRYSPAHLAFLMARRLETMLDCGFTTVRDAGGAEIGFKRALEDGLIRGPRLLASMRPLSQTGGHGDARGPAEPGDYHYEGEFGMTHVIADGVDDVRRAVREQLRRGADDIKVIASGGAVSHGAINATQYSLPELTAAVEVAAAAGKYVMAHALPSAAINNCIDAGVRSIEHGNFLDAATATRMAESGTYLVPTLFAYEHDAKYGDRYGYSVEVREKLQIGADHGREALRTAVDHGVKVGSGSDAIGPGVALMGEEIVSQAEVMGAHEAIMAATRMNAEILGVSDLVGTIEEGKRADLIAVADNPLDSVKVLGSRAGITHVIQGGVFIRSTNN
jgi:imidazolonepropionase-like amidohydrolase